MDNTHFWNFENVVQLKTSVISFIKKDEGRSYRKKFWGTIVPPKPKVIFTFKARTNINETVSLDFVEYETDTHTNKKAITYIIKVIN